MKELDLHGLLHHQVRDEVENFVLLNAKELPIRIIIGNSIDQFYRANERERPNDQKFKMLYNPDLKFKNRADMNFNCALKLIKLRTPLT